MTETPRLTTKIREWRKFRGITRKELADRSKVNVVTLWRLENNLATNPHTSTLAAIARALDITVFDLYQMPGSSEGRNDE